MIIGNYSSFEIVVVVSHIEYGDGREHKIPSGSSGIISGPSIGNVDGEDAFLPIVGVIGVYEGKRDDLKNFYHVSKDKPLRLEWGSCIVSVHCLPNE